MLGWLTRKEDSSFWERAADVCGLYLNPPATTCSWRASPLSGGSVTDLDASTGKLVNLVSGRAYQFNQPSAVAVAASDVSGANFQGNSVTQLPS